LTIDTHHHMLPDFFWRETENAHAPVGGLAPLRWSKDATLSFIDDAGIDVAVVDVDASLEELSYAIDVLGLDGFVLFTNSKAAYRGTCSKGAWCRRLRRRRRG